MKKRGQMYIVAALIIATLIFGLGAIYNYAKSSKEDSNILDLSREIDYETSSVIDWGVFTGKSSSEIDEKVKELTQYYANLNPRTELVTIFGDLINQKAYHYKLDSTGKICIKTGACSEVEFFKKISEDLIIHTNINNLIKIVLDTGAEYEFKLKEGQNFYIVLIKQKDDEQFVVAPEQID